MASLCNIVTYLVLVIGLKIVNRKKMAPLPVMKSRKMSTCCKNNYNQSKLLLLFNNFVMEWKGWSAMEDVENGIQERKKERIVL